MMISNDNSRHADIVEEEEEEEEDKFVASTPYKTDSFHTCSNSCTTCFALE
jgi:hypothetical protein